MPFFIKPPITMPFKFCALSRWNRGFSAMVIDIVLLDDYCHNLCPPIHGFLLYLYVPAGGLRMWYHFAVLHWSSDELDYHTSLQQRGFWCWLHPGYVRFRLETPFFAPALCWCAWTMEPSNESSSSSASRLKTRKILSRMPSSIHLRKRL